RRVDIVSCCTSSAWPVFKTEWLEPGMHVTDVSPGETEPEFARSVDVTVKAGDHTISVEKPPEEAFYSRSSFFSYVAGQPDERAIVPRLPLRGEIVEMPKLAHVLAGRSPGRSSSEQTTWFLNIGAIGVQFEAVAAAVYNKAVELGKGTEIPTSWFLQDIRD
ncbi:MAG: hypothetical protein ACRDHZ_13995, partial [Ktedonobacteraceae bacterium]